jgi:amidase
VTDDVREAVEETAALLARLGHSVEQRDPGYTAISYAHTVPYFAGMHAEAALLQRQDLEPRTRSLVRAGALCEALVPTALRVAAAQARRLTRLFHEFDVLLTPVVPGPPPEVGRWRGRGALRTLLGVGRAWPPFTLPWNLTGQPAASVPAGFDAEGLPLGVQLVGRPDAETTLVALAAQVEGERDWAVQTPPTQL